jgi:hypothetical protein
MDAVTARPPRSGAPGGALSRAAIGAVVLHQPALDEKGPPELTGSTPARRVVENSRATHAGAGVAHWRWTRRSAASDTILPPDQVHYPPVLVNTDWCGNL